MDPRSGARRPDEKVAGRDVAETLHAHPYPKQGTGIDRSRPGPVRKWGNRRPRRGGR